MSDSKEWMVGLPDVTSVVSLRELVELIEAGKLKRPDLVKRLGEPWRTAGEVPELADYFTTPDMPGGFSSQSDHPSKNSGILLAQGVGCMVAVFVGVFGMIAVGGVVAPQNQYFAYSLIAVLVVILSLLGPLCQLFGLGRKHARRAAQNKGDHDPF